MECKLALEELENELPHYLYYKYFELFQKIDKEHKALEIILKNYKLCLGNQENNKGEIKLAMWFPVYEHKLKFLTQEEYFLLKEVLEDNKIKKGE